jgi:hypothetical protein
VSVVGLVVGAAVLAMAVTPVSDGMEKNVPSHWVGASTVMEASLVKVTTSGLLDCPLAATVTFEVSV